MTAPLTTRRRYVNGAPAAILNTAINAAATTFALSTGTGFPPVPFPLILDFEGPAEEVVLIKTIAGATVTDCTRGFDGTAAQSHSVGATCVHGIIAKDPEEASLHMSSTAAHGTTTPLLGSGDTQTMTNKTISSSKLLATATDPGAKVQAAATGSAPQIQALDAAGAVTVFSVGRTGAALVNPTDPAVVPLIAKMATAQTANGVELQSSAGTKLLVADAKGRIVQRPSDLTAAAYKYVPPASTSAIFLQVRDTADAADMLLIQNTGEISSAAKAWLRGFFTDDPLRYPLDGSKFKVDSDGDVIAHNMGGPVARGQITADAGPTVGAAELVVVSASAFTPVNATRLIKITCHWRGIVGNTLGDIFELRIKRDSTVIDEQLVRMNSTGQGQGGGTFVTWDESPSASAHTYRLAIHLALGSGVGTVSATATGPCQIFVEDKGSAV